LGDRKAHSFDARFFTTNANSKDSYSALMVTEDFYERFNDRYQHILIHQTDAFVFEDQLELWASRPFDFIGSPHWAEWGLAKERGLIGVGNGGFSLRRVESFMRVLRDSHRPGASIQLALPGSQARSLRRARKGQLVEDIYWGYYSPLRVASTTEAIAFAFEAGLEFLQDEYRNLIPFGCHAAWNLRYIGNYQRGIRLNRNPEYERVLYALLDRSGSGGSASPEPMR
jgi:hypothetical protein